MAKKFAMIFGWILLVLGLLGFFSNPIIGGAVGAWFAADAAHNIVHLLTGIIFLWVAYGAMDKAGTTLKVFGVIYLLLAIVGFFSGAGKALGLIMVNGADNWLHLIFGLLFLWGGMSKKSMMATSAPMGGQQM